ncbi:PAS domain S-box protein [Paenibacillus hunanensis]|uniref:PAS domain S-box protein n=1 Tax=Paenibacillus hunanensis TaxID=539262 RepID=UPI002A6B54E2|nr:PAS domain S-box protein [Paenibacillus hunanensis]WPP40161.1 PAS domain S-box protein [Paenibacillus hunanensis]
MDKHDDYSILHNLITESGVYRPLFEHHPDAIYVMDMEGNYVYTNPAVLRMTGYAPEELLTIDKSQIFGKDRLYFRSPYFNRVMRGESVQFETEIYHKQGHTIYLDVTYTPVTSGDQIVGIFGAAKDITARKQADEQLRKSEERLTLAQDIGGFGCWDWSMDTDELICTPNFFEIMHMKQDTPTLLYRRFLASIHPDDRARVSDAFRQMLTEGSIHLECQLMDSAHPVKTIAIRGRVLAADANHERRIIGTVQDITEQRLLADLIRESERQYRMLSENTMDLISTHTADDQLRFLYASPSLTRLLGYEPDEMLGQSAADYYHPEDRAVVQVYVQSILYAREQHTVCYRFRHKQGHYVWLESSGTHASNGSNDPFGTIVAVSRDVSDRKFAEQQLLESEQRYKSLVEYNPSGVYSFDMEGRLYNLNPVAEIQSGYAVGRMGELHFIDLIDEKHQQDAQHHFDRARMGLPQNYETTLIQSSGNRMEVNITNVPIIVGGQITGVFGIATDITESKRYLEQIQALSEEYNLILSSVSEGIFGIDTNGRGIFINEAAARMLQLPREQFIGMPLQEALVNARTDGEAYLPGQNPVRLTLADGLSRQVLEEVFFRRDGSSFFVSYRTNALFDRGRIIGAVVVFSDRTSEREILEAKEMAERAASAKTQFISMMSHELRTPMNAIVGMSELIQDSPLDDEQRWYMDIIVQNSHELVRIMDDITDVNRLENGHVELEEYDFDLYELMDSVYQLFLPQAENKQIQVSLQIEQEVPLMVKGDMFRLRQVLVNIIGNAIKFTDHGQVEIVVSLSHLSREHGAILDFRIVDTGIGIPADRLNELFHSFSQVHHAMNRHYGGTGLGLFISKNLIELMKGTIGVESRENSGSTFYFTLPFQLATQ